MTSTQGKIQLYNIIEWGSKHTFTCNTFHSGNCHETLYLIDSIINNYGYATYYMACIKCRKQVRCNFNNLLLVNLDYAEIIV